MIIKFKTCCQRLIALDLYLFANTIPVQRLGLTLKSVKSLYSSSFAVMFNI